MQICITIILQFLISDNGKGFNMKEELHTGLRIEKSGKPNTNSGRQI